MPQLTLALESYAGPLDVLLDLVQKRKIEIEKVDILDLATQYIAFVETLDKAHIAIAAEYLRMACYLAWLKSRLMLPKEEREPLENLTDEELEAQLQLWMQHISHLRNLLSQLFENPQESRDFFRRGYFAPFEESMSLDAPKSYSASLGELIAARAEIISKNEEADPITISKQEALTTEEAVAMLRARLKHITKDWVNLWDIMQPIGELVNQRSVIAATFAAALELARLGELALRQNNLASVPEISNAK